MKQMPLPGKKPGEKTSWGWSVYPIIYKVLYIPGGTPKTGRVYPWNSAERKPSLRESI